jgi:hypothetical protein
VKLAFVTGALAAGVATAALTAAILWAVTLVSGSSAAWAPAIWLVPLVGAILALATYLAEYEVHRQAQARARATGEPWAYRDR